MRHSYNRRDKKTSLEYHVVVGGHDADPDPQKAGRVRTRNPYKHGPNVLNEHRPFMQVMNQSASDGQANFNRPPRPGQTVLVMEDEDGYGLVLGIPHGIAKPGDKSIPGNASLDSIVQGLRESAKDMNVRIPPDVEQKMESNRSGLQRLVKKLVEKGKKDNHKLYEGIPGHGALSVMAGIPFKELIQISTALTPLAQRMTSSVLGQLGGQMPDMGNLLNNMTSGLKSQLMGSLSSDMQAALQNLLGLLGSEKELSSPGNFEFGGKVKNASNFAAGAVGALSGKSSVGALEDAVKNVMGNATRLGANNADSIITIQTNFGEITLRQNANGNIEHTNSDSMDSAISAFKSFVSGIPSAMQNLFGDDTKIPEILQRLKTFESIQEQVTNYKDKHPSSKAERQRLQFGKTVTIGAQWLGGGGSGATS